MFSTKHLIILAICAVFIVAGYLLTRKWTLEQLCKRLLVVGVISELIKVFYYIMTNEETYGGNPNINFMYVASPPQSGLPFLTEKYGWLVYICHYGFTVLFCVTLCYIKPIVVAIKGKLSRKKIAV